MVMLILAVCAAAPDADGVAVTLTVYVPFGAVETESPPQPFNAMPAAAMATMAKTEKARGSDLRRNTQTTPARLSTPRDPDIADKGRSATLALVVVPTTRLAVADPPAVRVVLAGLTTHAACAGMPEHDRFTEPLKAAFAARLRVTTAFCPRLSVSEVGFGVRVNAGVREVTVTDVAAEVFGLKFASPLYDAVMLCAPTARALDASVAVEPLTATVPRSVVPS